MNQTGLPQTFHLAWQWRAGGKQQTRRNTEYYLNEQIQLYQTSQKRSIVGRRVLSHTQTPRNDKRDGTLNELFLICREIAILITFRGAYRADART